MKTHLIAIFCLVSISLMGQKTYAPAWESLDTRPVPSCLRMQSLGFLSTGAYGKLQFPALETPVSSV